MAGPLSQAAAGPDDPVALLETELFAHAAYRQYGVELRGYDGRWLHARLQAYLQGGGGGSVSSLQGAVLRDAALARAVFRFVSANQAPFFTRPASFMGLRCAVLPLLRSVTWPVVWIAECADPAFVTALAVMLDEEGLLPRTQLFATNANEQVLAEVSRLRLAPADLAVHEERHARGGGQAPLRDFLRQDEEGFALAERLREHIVWSQHDLTADASFNECHLVVCQRTLSDFGAAVRKRALGLFGESLCNFGILQIDAGDAPPGAELAREFACLLGEQGVYKRLPTLARAPLVMPALLRAAPVAAASGPGAFN